MKVWARFASACLERMMVMHKYSNVDMRSAATTSTPSTGGQGTVEDAVPQVASTYRMACRACQVVDPGAVPRKREAPHVAMGCPRCVCIYRSRGCQPEALATVYSCEPEALAAPLQYLRSQPRLNLP
jgi:hypothetical protein